MEIIERPIYLNRIVPLLNTGMMIVLTGQRRVGKSCILRQLQTWITQNRTSSHVLYINKELKEFKNIVTDDDLYESSISHLPKGGDNYLLIDEVQDIRNYENALRSLHAEERCQIVLTGSNAYIFSSELATRLSGRYVEIPIYSLTYGEFLTFHGKDDSNESLQDYIRVGGLPGLRGCDISDESNVRYHLQGVYDTIMMRDVLLRQEVRNVEFIQNLANFIADNTGKLISVRNITKFMNANVDGRSQREKVTEALTSAYLRHLCAALIITPVTRYDIHGKKLFEQNHKYYFSDHGLRNVLCGFDLLRGIEKILENIVWHHLVTQEFKVTVGILRNGEVDFIATRGSKRIYIQVTYFLSSYDNIEREFGVLKRIKDNYPKYVISMESLGGEVSGYPGILHVNLRNFLMTEL